MLTGAGVVGLAIAFAARETLANFFGTVVIILDVPFRCGDRIKINGMDGIVKYVSSEKIIIETKDGEDVYILIKFVRSNSGTCMRQKPIVEHGQMVKAGDVLADGPSTNNGELSIGKNILVAFMPWEGYNFDDAILISDELVEDDVLTSVHIEEYEQDARDTKLGPEEITRDIPNIGEDALVNLDENGIVRIGAEVSTGDILVGKVTPKGETELTPEERLLRAIFGEKARDVKDTSLRVPHGGEGIVHDLFRPFRFTGTPGDGAQGCAAGSEQIAEGGDQSHNGKNQTHAGQGQTGCPRQMAQVDPVHHIVQHLHRLGDGQGDGLVQNIAPHFPLGKVVFGHERTFFPIQSQNHRVQPARHIPA